MLHASFNHRPGKHAALPACWQSAPMLPSCWQAGRWAGFPIARLPLLAYSAPRCLTVHVPWTTWPCLCCAERRGSCWSMPAGWGWARQMWSAPSCSLPGTGKRCIPVLLVSQLDADRVTMHAHPSGMRAALLWNPRPVFANFFLVCSMSSPAGTRASGHTCNSRRLREQQRLWLPSKAGACSSATTQACGSGLGQWLPLTFCWSNSRGRQRGAW